MAEDNGTSPAQPPADEAATPAGVPASDRAMALFGIFVGLILIAIAVDLWTGGTITDLIPTRASGEG